MAQQSNTLKLKDAAALTPAATGRAGEWVAKMGEALQEAMTPDDVKEILRAVVGKAKQGDPKAVKQVLDFVGKMQPQVVVGVRGRPRSEPRTVEAVQPQDADVRRDCAEVLGRFGPLGVADLARRAGYSADEVEAALGRCDAEEMPLFERDRKGDWKLTATGRRTLLAG